MRYLAIMLVMVPGLAFAGPENLVCHITDNFGNSLYYAFAPNTHSDDGSPNGTFVETAFEKNGTTTTSVVGRRPVWHWADVAPHASVIRSQNDPGWAIALGWLRNGAAPAALTHNGRTAGRGGCVLTGSSPGLVPGAGDQALPPPLVADQGA